MNYGNIYICNHVFLFVYFPINEAWTNENKHFLIKVNVTDLELQYDINVNLLQQLAVLTLSTTFVSVVFNSTHTSILLKH